MERHSFTPRQRITFKGFAIITALCFLLSSCSPRPISGQVSVVTQAGASFSLGGVQVEVISAQDADDYMQQCQAQIDAKVPELKKEYDTAKNYDAATRAESQTQTAATKAELELARTKLKIAAHALKNFPTANDYFAGFMPSPIETTVTDAEGAFTIGRPKQAAKVFAKAQKQTSDFVENYYWLVDLPATGDKLILNNNNMFTVPR
ncbi:MAG TPA: hypothetical protein VMF08_06525 [Candidatus Sulfotelmatobacter sp.]|nr:hypothetical protein [Candidatus Sulfotelmatobacter sp.]